jgi:nucleoside-diphosphate-sugar epimerase
VEVCVGSLTDVPSLERAVKDCNVVFHFAGVLSEFKPLAYYRQVNVEGTRALARAAVVCGVERFIHTSTVWVYGMSAGTNINENFPRLSSGHLYADTKQEAEAAIFQLVKEQGLPAVVIQPSEVYGPNDPNWTMRPIERLRCGQMIWVDGGNGLIQPIYIDDLVDGILAAAHGGAIGQAYILCGNQVVTIRDYFGYFARMLEKNQIPSVPGWLALRLATLVELAAQILHRPPIFTRGEIRALMLHATYDGNKAQRELGFTPKLSLEEGMRKVETWLHQTAV